MPLATMRKVETRPSRAQGRRLILWRGGRWFVFGAVSCGLAATVMTAQPASAAPQIFSGAGTADATTALNDFRAAIGGINNGTTPVPQNGGRREINWDAVKLDGTDFGGKSQVIIPDETVGIPVNRFQARGAFFDQIYAVSLRAPIRAPPDSSRRSAPPRRSPCSTRAPST